MKDLYLNLSFICVWERGKKSTQYNKSSQPVKSLQYNQFSAIIRVLSIIGQVELNQMVLQLEKIGISFLKWVSPGRQFAAIQILMEGRLMEVRVQLHILLPFPLLIFNWNIDIL